jgi:hypothetical protein
MTKIVADLTGWNTRYESLVIGILIFLSSLLALLLKKRLQGKLEVFDVVIPFIFLNLYQWEVLVGVPSIAVAALPLFFILLTAVLITYASAHNNKVDIAILAINFFTIYTGFGIFLGLIVPGYFLLRAWWDKEGRYKSLIFSGLSVLSLLSFFINHRQENACWNEKGPQLLSYVKYVSLMINAFIGFSPVSPIYLLLPLLFAASFIYLVLMFIKSRDLNKHFPIVMLFAYSFLFAIFTSLGRICLGINQGQASRYMTFLIPLYFGFYLFLSLFTPPKIRGILIAAVVLLFIVTSTYNISLDNQKHMTNAKRRWKECYLQYENLDRCNTNTGYRVYPANTAMLQWELDYLKKNRLNLYLDATAERHEPIEQNAGINPSNEGTIKRGPEEPIPANSQSLSLAQGDTDYSVDTVANVSQPKEPVVIDSTTTPDVTLAGWAVDSGAKTEAGGVFINVDGKTDIPMTYGTERPDVAAVNNNPRYKQSGFAGSVPVSVMGKGRHTLSLRILTFDRKNYYQPGQQIVLDVK